MRVAHEGTGAGTWEYVASTGELIWSKELFRLYGRSPAAGVPTREEWASLVHPEDHRDCPWIFPDRLFRPGILTTEFRVRSEEHTSELQSLMRPPYAVFCLNKKSNKD